MRRISTRQWRATITYKNYKDLEGHFNNQMFLEYDIIMFPANSVFSQSATHECDMNGRLKGERVWQPALAHASDSRSRSLNEMKNT